MRSRSPGARPPSPAVLHADLDAFYASVEVVRDPTLKGKPVIVGGTFGRGVVTSASYEARKFGVGAAMPVARARLLCPQGIFIQPDMDAYAEHSSRVMEVFGSFSCLVEPLSLDEAFIDAGPARRMWAGPVQLARALRIKVLQETGLTVSVGVAPNKFLAKLASSKAKPDGMLVIGPEQVTSFLHPLPVGDLWGVGPQCAAVLQRRGYRTVADIAAVPASRLEKDFGSLGAHIARLSAGHDDRPVIPDVARKSLGAEQTFERDLAGGAEIHRGLLALSDRAASRLRAVGASGHTVTLKVRFTDFTTVTRSKTLSSETDSTALIYRIAKELLPAEVAAGRKPVRLLGVSICNLIRRPASERLSLEPPDRWPHADQALDEVRMRFGREALQFGSLLEKIT